MGRVLASDKDALANGSVFYSLRNNQKNFSLDRDTGYIYPRVSLVANQEFKLEVSDLTVFDKLIRHSFFALLIKRIGSSKKQFFRQKIQLFLSVRTKKLLEFCSN